jgi:hypothetical protein
MFPLAVSFVLEILVHYKIFSKVIRLKTIVIIFINIIKMLEMIITLKSVLEVCCYGEK